jgi:DNA-binding transcriptional ArsR family regulator
MLTYEEKELIIQEFPQLTRKEVSLNRINYHYEESLYDKTTVVYHLHPNGNGFLYVGDLPQYKEVEEKGLVNIREVSGDELRQMIKDSIAYLATAEEELVEDEIEEEWRNKEESKLTLLQEDTLWNIYHGYNLEESFGSYDEAKAYLVAEGFRCVGTR